MKRQLALSFLVAGVLATPAVAGIAYATPAKDVHAEVRIYDRQHKDYHAWNDVEDRAYRGWLETKHYSYRQYARLRAAQQREYWRWRHDHP